ncbi:hypothetical protein [Pseudomonas agarici]|uniref:hypothetical protein n=1 Tax=Pseudomonas agarici TaxID=46677 RepID=UPI0015A3326D|nr:hypothetical protein [Pseudomonas agarici]NWB91606.1 hypothetical protein [Pseudomonas agarici]
MHDIMLTLFNPQKRLNSKMKIKTVNKILVATGFIATIILAPLANINHLPRLGVFVAIGGCFILFITALEVEQERFLKGMTLIVFGVLLQLFYPKYFTIFLAGQTVPVDINEHLEIFSQVILLACSGAGGSIIANYADKNTSNSDRYPTLHTIKDNTQHILNLIENTKKLDKKFNIVIFAIAFFLLANLTITTIALVKIFH